MDKIFLIEDNPDHALLITKGLASDGAEVIHYPDGQSALGFLEKEKQPENLPVLVMLDLKLPGMDGFEILQRIRSNSRCKRIPVVMLTTSKYKQEINRAYELGASGFVTKSEDFSELLGKLARVKDYWLKTVEKPDAGG